MKTIKNAPFTKERINEKSVEQQNKDLIRYAVEQVWNRGDYSDLDQIISSDFVVHSLEPSKEVHGYEGVKRFYSTLRAAFPDIKFTIISQVAEGNKVVTQWVAEGTHLGDFDGIAPTKKRFRISAIDIDIIEHGRVKECWTNVDELGLLQQLGILDNSEADPQKELRRAWGKIARGYDQFVTDTEIWLANEALQMVGLQPGQTFLDVAAGCGGLSLPAARLGAKVLATDWSPEMIECFELRVRKEGLTDAKGKVMDGHHLELDDNQFDVSGSQFGVMLFPDQPRALREMVRVTKHGGKVLMIAYGDPAKIEFLNFFIAAIQSVAPQFQGLPTDPLPLEFQAADPAVLHQRLSSAGLKDIQVQTVTEKLEFNSGQQFWDWNINGNPIVGNILSELQLNEEQVGRIKQKLDQMIRERAGTNKTAILTDPVNIGFGIK